tara:strand:+ start:503 stop:1201 length:699 start_codon:yes stop_codon:yes gene_type:complete
MKRSKKYTDLASLIDRDKKYSPKQAIDILFDNIKSTFSESIEVHFKLGIDPRHADQQLRGTHTLPNGTGKSKTILVIAEGENAKLAQDNGADFVGTDEYIEKIQKGWFDFDLIITTPNQMRKLGRLGKTLGSKGLMPNPKAGTVTTDIEKTVKEFKSGKFEYRNDKEGNMHIVIGNVKFEKNQILENFDNLYEFMLKEKPSKSKGAYFESISLCSTQSPSIFIEPLKIKWDD